MNIQSYLVLLGMILTMPVYAEKYINDGLPSQVTTYTLAANADSDGIIKAIWMRKWMKVIWILAIWIK